MSREANEKAVLEIIERSTVNRAAVEKHGLEREVDMWELFTAQAALRGIRLWRYRKSPELQAAIRRARTALAEVWDEMRGQR